MIDQLKPLIGKLCSFSQKRLGFSHPPRLFLRNDSHNSENTLGKTAFYDPNEKSVTLFIHNRHPKDILRSFAHELVHHAQNLRGDLAPEKITSNGPGYAQECPHMRKMEKEAYLKGNMCFRDWEDEYKLTLKLAIKESIFLKENKKVNIKELKGVIKKIIQEQAILSGSPKTSFKDYEMNVNILKSLYAMVPKDEQEKINFYKNPGNKALIQQMADLESALKKLDGTTYDSSQPGTGSGDQIANLASRIPQIAARYKAGAKQVADAENQRQDRLAKADAEKEFASMMDSPEKSAEKFMKGQDIRGAVPMAKIENDAEIARLGKQQIRFLKRAGVKSMKQLQAKVGAQQTGVYDSQTNAKIKEFQKSVGAVQDGVFGGDTARAAARLNKGKKSPKKSPKQQADDALGFVGNYVDKMMKSGEDLDKKIKMAGTPTKESVTKISNETLKEMIEAQLKQMLESEVIEEKCGCEKAPGARKSGRCKVCGKMHEQIEEEIEELEEKKGKKKSKAKGKVPKTEKEKKFAKLAPPKDKITFADKIAGATQVAEGKVQTPEQENTLYEQRFTPKNNRLFEKLLKEWTK